MSDSTGGLDPPWSYNEWLRAKREGRAKDTASYEDYLRKYWKFEVADYRKLPQPELKPVQKPETSFCRDFLTYCVIMLAVGAVVGLVIYGLSFIPGIAWLIGFWLIAVLLIGSASGYWAVGFTVWLAATYYVFSRTTDGWSWVIAASMSGGVFAAVYKGWENNR